MTLSSSFVLSVAPILLILILGTVIDMKLGYGQQENLEMDSKSNDSTLSFLPSFSLFESEKVILVSHRVFDEDNILHIEGEVKNNSTDLLQNVQVNASFYGSNNLLQYFKDGYTNPEIMTRGMSAEFKIDIDKENIREVKGYRLEVSWKDVNFDNKIAKMLDITDE